MEVSFRDAFNEIVVPGGPKALAKFKEWSADPRYQTTVVPFVTNLTHRRLFAVDRPAFEAVRAVIESDEREHALYQVHKSDDGPDTKNLNPSWAFVQLFHKYVEEEPQLPTWLQWREWLATTAKSLFAIPVSRQLRFRHIDEERREAARRGLRWRLGNAYYSCMRELDVLIRLRDDYGIHARYHVLADALYRVDYWVGTKTMSLFINNSEMKAPELGGRKERPSVYLSSLPMVNLEAVLEKQRTYGNLHLASDAALAVIAAALG